MPPEGNRPLSPEIKTYPSVEAILGRIDPPLPDDQQAIVRRAYELAEKRHEGQVRVSGEPYFSHCVEVAILLADRVSDAETLAAGLLHDTIEDCGVTPDQIRALIPGSVADLVDGVTKISKISFTSDREQQANNLRKMILAMARDVRVVLIKLCDRLHNMRTLKFLPPEKQKKIATSTLEIFAPLATRLGMEEIADELEDLSMSYIQPVIYRRLTEHMERNGPRYQKIIARSRGIIEAELAKSSVSATVSGRIKHIFSVYQKMLRGGLGLSEIHDLIAMRILTESVSETYEALGIVHSLWKPVAGRFKDYIASPKPNGYRSLHTTVIGEEGEITEIQIRTREMHRGATEGIAAHWNYKEEGSGASPETSEAEKLAWLRQLVDWLSDIRDPQEWMAAVKQDVFDASVFCYTPQGEVIELPKGSTVLDFAYRIHTDLGNHCAGCKINHKMAPLRTRVQNGDIVEIIQSKSAHPTRDWLQFTTSSRARNKIRHWLKINDRDFYLDKGRQMFFATLREKGIELDEHAAMRELEEVARQFSLPTPEDVFVEIGCGTLKAGPVVSHLMPTGVQPPPARKKTPRKAPKAHKPGTILVEGMPGALVHLARCCAPSQGDPILGFITQGRGISVHRSDCPSLNRSRQVHANAPHRIVMVQWSDGQIRQMRVTIRVGCQDRQGLLNDISMLFTTLGISITDVHSHSNLKANRAIIKITVLLADENELNSLLNRLATIPSVRSVSRVIHSR